MYKGAASKEQYLGRTGSFSTRPSAKGVDRLNLGAGQEEIMTPKQQREALTSARTSLLARIEHLKRLRPNLTSVQARMEMNTTLRDLGLEYQGICNKLSALKPLLSHHANGKADIGEYIINVCRERFTKPEWEIVMKEARKRYDNAVAEQENSP